MNLRGELTTQQLVIMIVLIASFSILLLFLLRFDFKGSTREEICRESVVLASKSGTGVSLNCQTSYECLSSGDSCQSLKSAEIVRIKNDQEIVEHVADSLVSCWNMYWKGEYDFVSFSAGTTKSCGICNEFILKDLPSNGLRTGLSNFLSTKEFPGTSGTYFQYKPF